MARISGIEETSSRDFGDSFQFTNWISYSGATCHMIPQISDFIPGLLEDTDKYIEVLDGHQVVAKKKGTVQIKMFGNNIDTFMATFHSVLLSPYICDRLFSMITLINLGLNFYFTKGYV